MHRACGRAGTCGTGQGLYQQGHAHSVCTSFHLSDKHTSNLVFPHSPSIFIWQPLWQIQGTLFTPHLSSLHALALPPMPVSLLQSQGWSSRLSKPIGSETSCQARQWCSGLMMEKTHKYLSDFFQSCHLSLALPFGVKKLVRDSSSPPAAHLGMCRG